MNFLTITAALLLSLAIAPRANADNEEANLEKRIETKSVQNARGAQQSRLGNDQKKIVKKKHHAPPPRRR